MRQLFALDLPLKVFVAGIAILGVLWWIKGAQLGSLWFYLIAVWCVIYAAYELHIGYSKGKTQRDFSDHLL